MINLISKSKSSIDGESTSLTTDSSTGGSEGVLSLTSRSRCTTRIYMALVGSIEMYEFGGGISIVSSDGSTISSWPVLISSVDTSSSGFS